MSNDDYLLISAYPAGCIVLILISILWIPTWPFVITGGIIYGNLEGANWKDILFEYIGVSMLAPAIYIISTFFNDDD